MLKHNKIIYGKKSIAENDIIYVNRNYFRGPPINYQDLTIYLNLKKQIEKLTIDDKPFLQLFGYNDISLWWFFHFGPFFNDYFFNSVNFVSNFHKLIKQSNPHSIKIVSDFEMFDTIKQICHKNTIKFEYSKYSYFKFKILKNIKQNIRKHVRHHRLKKYVRLRIKNSQDLYYKKNDSIQSLSDKIVFAIPTSFRRPLFNPDTEKHENGEHIMQGIIDLLKNKWEIAGISVAHGTSKTKDDMLVERLESDTLWIPEEVLLQNYGKSTKQKKFLQEYEKLICNKRFQKFFEFEGINLWEQIKPGFRQMLHEPYLPYWLNLIDSYSLFFSSNKPKAIFLIAETDAPALAIISNAKRYNIKTIAIQHGEGIEDCEHSVSTFATSENPFGYPFPDKMLLFGEFWKRAFIKHNYPSEKFEVFGNPSFFHLDKLQNISNLSYLYKKYNLDKNKKIILFTTSRYQGYPDKYNFDVLVWSYLLQNFTHDNTFYIVLKIHPHEDITIYKKILKNYPTPNARITDGNVLELLSISSVLVSNLSTTLVDSICLKKPTIELQWDDMIQMQIPLKESNVVLSCNLNDLSKSIHTILNNGEIRNNLLKNREEFLKDHYNIPITKSELEKIIEKILC